MSENPSPNHPVRRGLTTRFPHQKIGYVYRDGQLHPVDKRNEAMFGQIMEEAALRMFAKAEARNTEESGHLPPPADLSLT